jgi:hypothetical protein
MLQDQSIDKIETMNFLERHLGDFQTTGCVRPSVETIRFLISSNILFIYFRFHNLYRILLKSPVDYSQ